MMLLAQVLQESGTLPVTVEPVRNAGGLNDSSTLA
jgi:hypothetical protein